MVEFKAKADRIIKERYGIEVERVRASVTYEDVFYKVRKSGKSAGECHGFPMTRGAWCQDRLKGNALDAAQSSLSLSLSHIRIPNDPGQLVQQLPQERAIAEGCKFSSSSSPQGAGKNTVVNYLGIAADEPIRLARLDGTNKVSPLAALGWTEADCRSWCEDNDLLSPIYTESTRGGCWFCHNQSVDQLRKLRKTYPDLWALLMKWDLDSPVSFRPNGITVHDFDRRFELEDLGKVPTDRTFRWKMLDQD